jgi:methylmalonyl-CoA mutase N-terminal domain/subunit
MERVIRDGSAITETDTVDAWRKERLTEDYRSIAPRKERFSTLSGTEIEDVYTPSDVANLSYERDIGLPGVYPFTRGVRASMYRGRPWTIRQVAGFGRAEDTNSRYKYLLAHGETGLSTDFDLPTLLGHDSDHPVYSREMGKIGVAIDTVADTNALFADIPLDGVSTSLTINASAAVLLAMYLVTGEESGVAGAQLMGTVQNDILKEYTAQNEFIFPPEPATELVVDTMEYAAKVMPRFNPVSVSGYHIREAGATAVEELALTLSAGVTYLQRASRRGIDIDSVAPRLSFFFDIHKDFFEEIAKLRAARRLWARLTKERLGCRDPKSWLMRIHAQTAGVSLTAQQPLNNVVRTTVEALAGVLGGVQSMHTNSLDEAYQIPSEGAIKVAIRTQQILLHETGVADVVDPLGGSYYIERLTEQVEEEALSLIDRIEELGGLIPAIESGYVSRIIADSSWRQQEAIEAGRDVIVGVNQHVEEMDKATNQFETFAIDPTALEKQVARLQEIRRTRDPHRAGRALKEVESAAARLTTNRMPFIEEAVRARCSVGEICDVLRSVWGEYPPSVVF